MKIAALLLLAIAQVSCTTLANRRDLYSPDPGPEARPLTVTRTQTTNTATTTEEPTVPAQPLPR